MHLGALAERFLLNWNLVATVMASLVAAPAFAARFTAQKAFGVLQGALKAAPRPAAHRISGIWSQAASCRSAPAQPSPRAPKTLSR